MLKMALVQSINNRKWGYCPEAARPLLKLEYDMDAPFISAEAAQAAAEEDPSIKGVVKFTRYPAPAAAPLARRHADNARAPNNVELDQITEALRQPMGLDEQEGYDLTNAARIMVFDHYISDGPGYAGRVAIVLHSGGPECVDVITWTDGKAARTATTL
jgi:hypothetical protein